MHILYNQSGNEDWPPHTDIAPWQSTRDSPLWFQSVWRCEDDRGSSWLLTNTNITTYQDNSVSYWWHSCGERRSCFRTLFLCVPASLMNFSITSGEQSLQVFTATLTLSPFCPIKHMLLHIHFACCHLFLMESCILWMLCNTPRINPLDLQLFCILRRRLPQKNPRRGFVQEQCHFGRCRISQLQCNSNIWEH